MSDNASASTVQNGTIGSDYLANLIKSISDNVPLESSKQDVTPSTPQPNPPSDLLSSLLSNPELLSKIPSIIATVKPIMEMMSSGSASNTTIPTFSATNASVQGAKNREVDSAPASNLQPGSDDRRAALLCALKPYLSDDRCRAIDYIIKLNRLGDVLKTL